MKKVWVITPWFPNPENLFDAPFVKEQVDIINSYSNGELSFVVLNVIYPLDFQSIASKNKQPIRIKWTYGNPKILVKQAQPTTISNRLPYFTRRSSRRQLAKLASEEIKESGMPDLIWAITLSGAFLTTTLFEDLGFTVPFFLQEHSNPLQMHLKYSWQQKIAAKLKLLDFDVVVVAERQLSEFRQLNLKRTPRIVYNPVNAVYFDKTQILGSSRDKNRKLKIASIGRITNQKNPLHQLYVAKELSKMGYEFEWSWVGDGDLKEQMEEKISLLQLSASFFLRGAMDNNAIKHLLTTTDVFVMTSFYENCPVALLEAQVMGVPCVISRNGSSEKVLLVGNGLVVKSEDAQVFADGIRQVINNQYDRCAIQERARSMFHPEVFYSNMKQYFNEC